MVKRWAILGHAIVREQMLILSLIVVGVGFVTFYSFEAGPSQDERTSEAVSATILRLGAVESRWRAGQVIVIATTTNGVSGQTSVPQEQLRGCSIGDTIPAFVSGRTLSLKPKPCDRKGQ